MKRLPFSRRFLIFFLLYIIVSAEEWASRASHFVVLRTLDLHSSADKQ
jgi:hypothetical protein